MYTSHMMHSPSKKIRCNYWLSRIFYDAVGS